MDSKKRKKALILGLGLARAPIANMAITGKSILAVSFTGNMGNSTISLFMRVSSLKI